MFGAICSGRPMFIANQMEQTKFVITIPNASNVSHLTIFLLPQTEFTDPNFTGVVYIQVPGSSEFKILGGLNPLKPSAIYKINGGTNNTTSSGIMDEIDMSDGATGIPNNGDATINIGISIEPTPQAELLIMQEKQKMGQVAEASNKAVISSSNTLVKPVAQQDIANLANRIVTHAYNYLSGFIDSQNKVSMKVFDTWWDKFKTKLQNNPKFLDDL